jgi:hypothetical protein
LLTYVEHYFCMPKIIFIFFTNLYTSSQVVYNNMSTCHVLVCSYRFCLAQSCGWCMLIALLHMKMLTVLQHEQFHHTVNVAISTGGMGRNMTTLQIW